jgi:hypothetical protein
VTPLMHKRTFWLKWGLPYAVVVAVLLWNFRGASDRPDAYHAVELVVGIIALVILYFVIRRQSREQPDEVLDGGRFLRVTFGNITEDIPISEIASVTAVKVLRVTRIVLFLRKPRSFGDTIEFYPVHKLDSSGRNEIAVNLERRVGAML